MKTKRVSLDLWKAIAIMLFAIVLVACGSSANAATDTSEAAAPADTTIDEAAEAQSSESAEAQSAEPAEAADHEDAEDADHEHSDEASSEPAVIAIAEEPVEDMIQPVATPLEKAVMGVGGAEALKNLHALSIEAGGVRHIHDEGFVPGGELRFVGPYAWQVSYDIAGDNLRVDHTYGSGENARMLSEIIAAELGALDGQATGSGAPGVSNMLSDRWASARKLQRLLNPHLILLDLMDDPSMAVEGGEVLHDGSVYHLLVVEDEVAPMALYINAGTGRIAKLTTTESHALRRDVPLEVFYYGWQPVGRDGLFFPAELYIAYDGGIVHKEIRTTITVNPDLDGDMFEFPEETAPVFDAALAARGEAMSLYLQSFVALGFPRDGFQTQVNAQELAPGVYHVTGGSHNSMVVEQADGIVVVEAPLDEVRSQAVMDWIAATFPGKPVSHAVASHHHVDHTGGLRSYVAGGATAVVHEAAIPLFERVLQATSNIMPDMLAANPAPATIQAVPAGGSFTIPDDRNPVQVIPFENPHAEDMVLVYVPSAGVAFVVDIYSPNPNATSLPGGALVVNQAIEDFGLDVSAIVGGHGGVIGFDVFESLLADQ